MAYPYYRSNDGVVIIGVTIDSKTHEIIANTDVQSRGFVYLRDSEHIIKGVIDIAEKCVSEMKDDPKLEAVEVRQNIKDKANKFTVDASIARRPICLSCRGSGRGLCAYQI